MVACAPGGRAEILRAERLTCQKTTIMITPRIMGLRIRETPEPPPDKALAIDDASSSVLNLSLDANKKTSPDAPAPMAMCFSRVPGGHTSGVSHACHDCRPRRHRDEAGRR